VHHALLVAVGNGADELTEVLAGSHLVEAAGANDLVEQLTTLNELQDEEDVALGSEDLFELHNVGVGHLLHDGDLLLDLSSHVLLLNLRLAQDLDGDLFAGVAVDGVLDLTEGTLTESFADFIFSDALGHGAGNKSVLRSRLVCWVGCPLPLE